MRAPTAWPRWLGPSPTLGDVEHRLDDLAVPGASTEHAAERVHHLLLGRFRAPAQEIVSRHEHARRADAALRRAVAQERRLQGEIPSPFASPSTVITSRPATWPTGVMQAQTCSPSSSTVQAPQSPASQPIFVPVRPSSSRKASARQASGAAWTSTARPVDDASALGRRMLRGAPKRSASAIRARRSTIPAASRR